MGVTGAIYSYDQQILKWVNTDSYVVQAQSSPKLTLLSFTSISQQSSLKLKLIALQLPKILPPHL